MAPTSDAFSSALRALDERVTRLEEHAAPQRPPREDTPADEPLWALSGLQSRLGDHASTQEGAVMIVGSLTLPDKTPVSWQQGAATSTLLETDWSELATAFSALGHPVRLEILRQILNGLHHTSELVDTDILGTTGQLHHHLRQLVAAGWVRQSGRGSYEIPAARIVPLLACLVGAQR